MVYNLFAKALTWVLFTFACIRASETIETTTNSSENNHALRGTATVNTNCWLGPFPASAATEFVASINTTQPFDGAYIGLTFTLQLAKKIDGGMIHYSSLINGFVPYNVEDDLCVSLQQGLPPIPCPLALGTHVSTGVVQASGVASLKLRDEWVASDGMQIACATVLVTL